MAATREEVYERVKEVLSEQLGVDENEITEEASFQEDLEADSLDLVELIMEELSKIRRVIEGRLEGAPHETLLVVDATTGQNGVRQAQLFGEAVQVSGVALTKLDGSAKGGVALAIAHELGLPVKLVGVGEGIEDLRPFNPREFAQALLTD